jgi:hypothetical protein
MEKRHLCPVCNEKPVAINYIKEEVVIETCVIVAYAEPAAPQWFKLGYRKKPQCEHCSFKFKLTEQSLVYHVDGNLKNNDRTNLKTVCLNCSKELYKSKVPWKPSPIVPDF